MKTRRHVLQTIALVALAFAAAACAPAAGTPSTPSPAAEPTDVAPGPTTAKVTIDISGESFGEPLTVVLGTTVEWVNSNSEDHTVTSDTGLFDSGTLAPGERFEHTFNEAGEFPYFCQLHGGAGGVGMAGVITVQG